MPSRALLFFEPPDGGVAENVLQLAGSLESHGWHPAIAGPTDPYIYDRAEAAGIDVHRLTALTRGFSEPRRDWKALGELRSLLRGGTFDLLHCHSAKAGGIGRIAGRAEKVPTVYSPHCFGFVGDVGWRRRWAVTALERVLGAMSSGIICACERELERALERRVIKRDRLRRIYYGSPTCTGEGPVDEALVDFKGSGVLVGAVTVLREQKRVDLLIDAAPAILAAHPDCRIAIVGNGPLKSDLENRARALGLESESRFKFFDFEPPSSRYLRALDVYVLPSAWEAMPIGALEALACGVPQVATDTEGTGEAVSHRETGLLVPPRSVASIRDAVLTLLSDPAERASMSEASRRRHAELFAVDRMVSETADYYDRCVALEGLAQPEP